MPVKNQDGSLVVLLDANSIKNVHMMDIFRYNRQLPSCNTEVCAVSPVKVPVEGQGGGAVYEPLNGLHQKNEEKLLIIHFQASSWEVRSVATVVGSVNLYRSQRE